MKQTLLMGWGFVSVVALVALVGIAGERLGLVDAVTTRIPAWLSVDAVLAGGYPISGTSCGRSATAPSRRTR